MKEVTFVGCVFDGLPVPGKCLVTKDLEPSENQKIYLGASNGQYIFIGV